MTTNETNETVEQRGGASTAQSAPEGAEANGETEAASQRVVPVGEAKKYRKRAQQAEQSLTELQQELQTKSQRVTELEQTIDDLERRSAIDQLLVEAEAIDLEAARLLTAAAVEQMDEPDVAEAVAELRRSKPFLFRRNGSAATAMSARADGSRRADDAADHAAAEALATGDRTDLLRYLRLRRVKR